MSETKSIILSGKAATDYATDYGGESVAKTRKSRRKAQQGGALVTQNMMNVVKGTESSSSVASSAGLVQPSTWLKQPDLVPPKIAPVIPTNTPSQLTLQQGGTTKQIKVELKKKPSTKKVHLQPKKVEAPKTPVVKKSGTRKVRKITLGVSSLHKRMTRANKVHKKMKEMKIDDIKKELIHKKLIKPTSKAPESILRQIAADAQIVAGKAL